MNGAALYIIIGAESSCGRVSIDGLCSVSAAFPLTLLENMSPTVPPATDRNADPASPSKKRATSIVCMLRATAHGIIQMRKKLNDAR